MAITAYSFTAGNGSASPVTVSHTPSGTPRGVIVFAILDGQSTDYITTCTYGGTSMTEVTGSPVLCAEAEDANVACFFLGSSVPTGTQNVVVSMDFDLPVFVGVYTLTASGDVEVIDTDVTINTTTSNPRGSSALSFGGRTCFVAEGIFSGVGAASGITEMTGWTPDAESDMTGQFAAFYSYDTIGTSDVTIGWDQSSDEAAAIGIAVSEVVSGDSTAPTYGTSPALDDRTDITITVDATASDETDATVNHYAIVLTNGATAPSTGTELKSWHDTGAGSNNVVSVGSDTSVSNAAEGSITLTSVSASTAYDVYYTTGDSSDNYASPTLIETTTRPGPTAAAVSADGMSITLTMSESVSDGGAYSESDFAFTASGGALTVTATSGLPGTSVVLTPSRVIRTGETITYNHTQPGGVGGLEGTTGGVWVPTWTGRSITNNSVQVRRGLLIQSMSASVGPHPSQDLNGLLE